MDKYACITTKSPGGRSYKFQIKDTPSNRQSIMSCEEDPAKMLGLLKQLKKKGIEPLESATASNKQDQVQVPVPIVKNNESLAASSTARSYEVEANNKNDAAGAKQLDGNQISKADKPKAKSKKLQDLRVHEVLKHKFLIFNVEKVVMKMMPAVRLTSAEKKQRFIVNLKRRGCFEEYKNKNAEHAKNRREQLKQSISKLTAVKQHELICESRSKCRKRVEKHRKQKKQQILMEKRLADQQNKTSKLASIGFDNSYRTESALRKAVGKTKKSLPASPSKQKAVFAKLYATLNPKDKEEIVNNTNSSKEKAYKRVSPELIKAIQEFYQRDDISRISPNVRDCKRFVNETTGAKEYRQVRHLMYKLNEIHALFVQEYTEGNIVFAMHRPS